MWRERDAIGEICVRDVVSAARDTPVLEAARLMRSRHVGDVVVVENGRRGPVPVGIVTDRDIVVGIIAPEIEVSRLTLGDIMSRDLITIPENQHVFETVEQMQRHGIRRLPVTDKEGVLFGIISIDDLTQLLAMQLSGLPKIITRERRQEIEARP
jgi:CBS domain-containing protein